MEIKTLVLHMYVHTELNAENCWEWIPLSKKISIQKLKASIDGQVEFGFIQGGVDLSDMPPTETYPPANPTKGYLPAMSVGAWGGKAPWGTTNPQKTLVLTEKLSWKFTLVVNYYLEQVTSI